MAHGDRVSIHLLRHLHRSSTSSLEDVQALIIHTLSHTSTPTALSATIISSSLFFPFTHAKLNILLTAFGHAVHARLRALEDEAKTEGIYRLSVRSRLETWTKDVLKGFIGGQAMLRLVGAGGLLLGLDDLRPTLGGAERRSSARGKAEDEVVVAMAEVMDVHGQASDKAWEMEFYKETESGEVDVLSMGIIFASQLLPHVLAERLMALPLSMLSSYLSSSIGLAFGNGTFLSSLSSVCKLGIDGKVSLSVEEDGFRGVFPYGGLAQSNSLVVSLHSLTSSPLFTSVASLAKLFSHVVPILVESRPEDGWFTVTRLLERLDSMTSRVESDWSRSPLADTQSDDDIAADSRELTASIWNVLKTLLFTSVMISRSVLLTVVYTPPQVSGRRSDLRASTSSPSLASQLSISVLRILARLSFVISTFGGLTFAGNSGFAELKRVFFCSLDLLSTQPQASQEFVQMISRDACIPQALEDIGRADLTTFTRSKLVFDLACIEQLVPTLSLSIIEDDVLPICLPHLSHIHHEIREATHSVMLAIFSAFVRAREGSIDTVPDLRDPGFVQKLIPMYTSCLLESSRRGSLNIGQLRVAYAMLLSSASIVSPSLAQLCLEMLLGEIRLLSEGGQAVPMSERTEQLHRLHLMLVSSLPSLSVSLLPTALDTVVDAMVSGRSNEDEEIRRRAELIQALFMEILEQFHDSEKEFALHWWQDKQATLKRQIFVKDISGTGATLDECSDR